MADSHATQVLAALHEIRDEIKELRNQFETFSNGGFPLRSAIPTSELVATAAAATAVLSRDLPLTPTDVQRRLQMAMLIARDLITQHDSFQAQTQPQQLENLAQR